MHPAKWLFLVLLMAYGSIGSLILVARTTDPFGLFTGQATRPVYWDESLSKYLFAKCYVPSNFSGLLLGTSTTALWDIKLDNFRIYNMSTFGGNYYQAELLTRSIFSGTRHPKLAIVTLSPYMAKDANAKSAAMSERSTTVARGSIELFLALTGMLARRMTNDVNGVYLKPAAPLEKFPGADDAPLYHFDPAQALPANRPDRLIQDFPGFGNLRSIYAILKNRCVTVVSIIAPVAPGGFPPQDGVKIDQFFAAASSMASQYGSVISGNDESFGEFRRQASNFSDLLHPSGAGATTISLEMSRRIARSVAAAPSAGGCTPGDPEIRTTGASIQPESAR